MFSGKCMACGRAVSRRNRFCAECRRRGERNGRAKLTEQDVLAIRAAEGTQADIAREFGICQSEVSFIKLKLAWKYL
jgi:hypothetical protein